MRIVDSGMVGHRKQETPPKEQGFLGISVCLIYQSCMEAAKQSSQGLTEEADLEGQRLVVVGIRAGRGYSIKGNKISLAVIFSQLCYHSTGLSVVLGHGLSPSPLEFILLRYYFCFNPRLHI